MKAILSVLLKVILIALLLGAWIRCDRGYKTIDAAYTDTITIDGKSNEKLQQKDPANWGRTDSPAPTAPEGETYLEDTVPQKP